MSDQFEWQTEDEAGWENDSPFGGEREAGFRKRPWLIGAFILLLLGAIGWIGYQEVQKRVELATTNVKADILASHNLLRQAANNNDAELMETLLSGREPVWTDWQRELVADGLWLNRESLGMELLPEAETEALTVADLAEETADLSLEVDPELSSAELTFARQYAVVVGNGVTETVKLAQTAVYRRGGQRWLYSPPDDDFWGRNATSAGSRLTLIYPERDAEIAERLAFDLNAKLEEMCRTLDGIYCPNSLAVYLRLSTDPATLANIASPSFLLTGSNRLELPTPTLVGTPVDDAGYRALLRGYGAMMATAIIADLVEYECCEHVAYFQVLLQRQLDQLSLAPYPEQQVDYNQVVLQSISADEFDLSWRSRRPTYLAGEYGWLVHTAVDFLRQHLPDVSVTKMQRAIAPRQTFSAWLEAIQSLSTVNENAEFRQNLEEIWQSYAIEQVLAQQPPLPTSLPEQDLFLLCQSDEMETAVALNRWQPDDQTWDEIWQADSFYTINSFPSGEALLIQRLSDVREEDVPQSALLLADGRQVILDSSESIISFGQVDPTEMYLLTYLVADGDPGTGLLDLADCSDGGDCTPQRLFGVPHWSPSGGNYLMIADESLGRDVFRVNKQLFMFNIPFPVPEWPIYRGEGQPLATDSDELVLVGEGYAPFWLDDSTYGYMRRDAENGRYELVQVALDDEPPQVLLTDEALLAALPSDVTPGEEFAMRYAAVSPQSADTLFVVAFDRQRQAYFFLLDRETGAVEYRLHLSARDEHAFGFSPNGSYVTMLGERPLGNTFRFRRSAPELFVQEVTSGETQSYQSALPFFAPVNVHAWSADEVWLAVIVDGQVLTLVAPEYEHQQILPHDLGVCAYAAWLNR